MNETQVFTISGTMPNAYGVQVDMGPNWQSLDFVSDAATFTWSTTGFYFDDDATGTPSDSRSVIVHALNICHSASASASLVVHNVDPTISLSAPAAIDEGSEVSVVLTFGDATTTAYVGRAYSADTWTIVVDWGDGNSSTYSNLAGGYYGPYSPFQSITATHVYVDDDPTSTPQDSYSITATIVDDDTGTSAATSSITVNNVSPTVTIDSVTAIDKALATDEDGNPTQWLNPGQLDESEGFIVRGTVTDPGIDDRLTVSVVVDLDWNGVVDSGETIVADELSLISPGRWAFRATIPLVLDDGSQQGSSGNSVWGNETILDKLTFQVEAQDDDAGATLANGTIDILNIDPRFVDDSSDPNDGPRVVLDYDQDGFLVGATIEAEFTDPGTQDFHRVTITWGDGLTGLGSIVDLDNSVRTFSIAQTFTSSSNVDAESLYPIDIMLEDDDLGFDIAYIAPNTCDAAAPTLRAWEDKTYSAAMRLTPPQPSGHFQLIWPPANPNNFRLIAGNTKEYAHTRTRFPAHPDIAIKLKVDIALEEKTTPTDDRAAYQIKAMEYWNEYRQFRKSESEASDIAKASLNREMPGKNKCWITVATFDANTIDTWVRIELVVSSSSKGRRRSQ